MDLIPVYQLSLSWIKVMNLYLERKRRSKFRRWWTKPHLRSIIRNNYGAYTTAFSYMKSEDHEEFRKFYRMTVPQFDELHEKVKNKIKKSFIKRAPLSSELRLAFTLHFLAQGDSIRTLSRFYLIGESTAYKIIAEVCKEIWNVFSDEYLKSMTPEEWKMIAEKYEEKWNFPHCFGAVDGKHIRIIMPPKSGSLYFNYKKYFSFVLMAMCDADYKFTWIDVGDYGSLSDTSIFRATAFAEELESGRYPFSEATFLRGTRDKVPYFMIGDKTFPIKSYMISPYPQRMERNSREENFNYRLSRARMTIENAFGILAARWRILLQSMEFNVQTSVDIVKCLICLHNFILSKEIDLIDKHKLYASEKLLRDIEGTRKLEEEEIEDDSDDDHISVFGSQIRNTLSHYFESEETGQLEI